MRKALVMLCAVLCAIGGASPGQAQTRRCYQTAGSHYYCEPYVIEDPPPPTPKPKPGESCVVGSVRGVCSAADAVVDAVR